MEGRAENFAQDKIQKNCRRFRELNDGHAVHTNLHDSVQLSAAILEAPLQLNRGAIQLPPFVLQAVDPPLGLWFTVAATARATS